MSAVGTLNRNKRLLPPAMTDPRGREAGSSKICFRNEMQLASYVPKAGKVVLVASTQHKLAMVDQNTGKPEAILFYNSTKGGVDVCDAILANIMCLAPVRRWPTKMLFFLLGVACLNAYHLYVTKHPDSESADVKHGGRMRFVRALALQMALEQAERRAALYASGGVLNKQAVRALEIMLDRDLSRPASSSQGAGASAPNTKPGRCVACMQEMHRQGYKAKKSKLAKHTTCNKCGVPACKQHSAKVCHTCL